LNLACEQESGWACNEMAILKEALSDKLAVQGDQAARMAAHMRQDQESRKLVKIACDHGFQPGCDNVYRFMQGRAVEDAPPTVADYRILLSLYKRRPALDAMSPPAVYAEACDRGWTVACGQ
jgi:hypothetical protein